MPHLFGFGERPVGDDGFSVPHAHGRGGAGRLERLAAFHVALSLKLFIVGEAGVHEVALLLLRETVEQFVFDVAQAEVFHGCLTV